MNQFLKHKTKWLTRILLVLVGLFVLQGSIATVSANTVNLGVNTNNPAGAIAVGSMVGGVIGGAVGGYTGGFSSSLISGASFAEALAMGVKGAVMGSFIGGISGGIQGFRQAKILNQNGWNGKPLGVKGGKWVFGGFKSSTKWANQLAKRGWTEKQIGEAINKGKSFNAINNVNKTNGATRFVHPKTGQSVVIDDVTKELLHVGGPGFKY